MALAHGRLGIGMVTTDCADPKGLATFWAAALDTSISGDYGEFVMLAPPPAGGPVLGFQLVPEERAGKNRLHLDLGAASGECHAEVERLVGPRCVLWINAAAKQGEDPQ